MTPKTNPINPEVSYGFCGCGCGEKTRPAKQSVVSKGIVRGEPANFLPGHWHQWQAKKAPWRFREEDRGYETPCWVWYGHLDTAGYANPKINGKMVKGHRWHYERCRGPIPPHLQLDHLCRVRACVNPDHLEAVSHVENVRRGDLTKLTIEQVRAIKFGPHRPYKEWAEELGVDRTCIGLIRRGVNWKDVQPA